MPRQFFDVPSPLKRRIRNIWNEPKTSKTTTGPCWATMGACDVHTSPKLSSTWCFDAFLSGFFIPFGGSMNHLHIKHRLHPLSYQNFNEAINIYLIWFLTSYYYHPHILFWVLYGLKALSLGSLFGLICTGKGGDMHWQLNTLHYIHLSLLNMDTKFVSHNNKAWLLIFVWPLIPSTLSTRSSLSFTFQ